MSKLRSPEDRRRQQLDVAVAAFQKAYAGAPGPAFALDWEGRRVYSNRAYDELVTQSDEDAGVRESSSSLAKRDLGYRRWLTRRLAQVLGAEILDHSVEVMRLVLRHPVHGPLEALFTGRELRNAEGERLGWIGFGVDPRTPQCRAKASDVHACLLELHRALEACRERLEELEPGPRSGSPDAGDSLLTEREREVLDELLRGYRVPAIARRLSISPYTVRNHLKSVFKKVGVQSQGELVEKLRRRS